MARQSFGFHKLLRPLPQTVQQVRQLNESQEDERLVRALAKCEDDSLISVSSEGFDNTPNRYKSYTGFSVFRNYVTTNSNSCIFRKRCWLGCVSHSKCHM